MRKTELSILIPKSPKLIKYPAIQIKFSRAATIWTFLRLISSVHDYSPVARHGN